MEKWRRVHYQIYVSENHKGRLRLCVPCLLLVNPAYALEGQGAQCIVSAS